MNSTELIGKVVCEYIKNHFPESDNSGTARYLLDCFSREQLIEIAKTILHDKQLFESIDIKLPSHYIGQCDLPADILTVQRTTYFRNADCLKPVLLIANTGDDEEQSLIGIVPIGKDQICAEPNIWVRIASEGLHITDEHRKWWEQALKGL